MSRIVAERKPWSAKTSPAASIRRWRVAESLEGALGTIKRSLETRVSIDRLSRQPGIRVLRGRDGASPTDHDGLVRVWPSRMATRRSRQIVVDLLLRRPPG